MSTASGLPDSSATPLTATRQVLVMGEALVDRFADGAVCGGAPFNLARSLSALGQRVGFTSRIGNDAAGDLLWSNAQAFGLDTRWLQRDPMRPTGVVDVSLSTDGQPTYAIANDVAWDHIDAQQALAALSCEPQVLCFNTLSQRSPTSRTAVDAVLAAQRVPIRFLDINLRANASRSLAQDSLKWANWVKLNHDELAQLREWFLPSTAVDSAAADLVRLFGLQQLVVTHGAAGYVGYDAQANAVAHGLGVTVADLKDTVGAGDGFSAAWLAAHLQGWTMPKALNFANHFAAAICSVRGPVPAHLGFYASWRERLQSPDVHPQSVC
jgi:fructokinase